jgi:hypothetical protein
MWVHSTNLLNGIGLCCLLFIVYIASGPVAVPKHSMPSEAHKLTTKVWFGVRIFPPLL